MNPTEGHDPECVSIRAVLFDFDGTLTEPGSLDYAAVRDAMGCPVGTPILEYIESLPSNQQRQHALAILNRFETAAAALSQPNCGAEELVRFLHSNKFHVGIISRNSLDSILRALQNFRRLTARDFDIILSRDGPEKPKPSPEGIQAAARQWRVRTEEVLVVGDFVFDIDAGQRAGARTAFLTNRKADFVLTRPPDYTIEDLGQLIEILRYSCPLPVGKLSNAFLDQFLNELRIDDASVIIGPALGEDVAAVSLAGEQVLVLKSDPVTFATDAIGIYTVVVGANDVATSGATARWVLASLLFPVGTTAAQIRRVMLDLRDTAHRFGLTLCGGHTEITDAVTRPVAAGQVIGTVPRSRLVAKRNMKTGDGVILTKRVAVEGTCVIAREFPKRLLTLGLSQDEIDRCRQFLTEPGISILKEAEIAARSGAVTAMHDVTEGGLSMALEELSAAGNHRIRVYVDRIPVFAETRRICSLMKIHPFGLLGSGSLLICCGSDQSEFLIASIRESGVEANLIGEVLNAGIGLEAVSGSQKGLTAWPHFQVDEIARLFGEAESSGEAGVCRAAVSGAASGVSPRCRYNSLPSCQE